MLKIHKKGGDSGKLSISKGIYVLSITLLLFCYVATDIMEKKNSLIKMSLSKLEVTFTMTK